MASHERRNTIRNARHACRMDSRHNRLAIHRAHALALTQKPRKAMTDEQLAKEIQANDVNHSRICNALKEATSEEEKEKLKEALRETESFGHWLNSCR